MPTQGFECNSCGYVLVAEGAGSKSVWCPRCRATMDETAVDPGPECGKYACPECGFSFCVPGGAQPPYKCPRCNYTFPSEPGRRVDHKL